VDRGLGGWAWQVNVVSYMGTLLIFVSPVGIMHWSSRPPCLSAEQSRWLHEYKHSFPAGPHEASLV
jgi:hypothetical protein